MAVQTAENLIEELRWRGLLHDITEGAEEALAAGPVTAYIGFDPTADSLHVGSLLPIMVLVHLQRHGHTPIALVGGGTGMIGDPSGKSSERNLLDDATLEHNLVGIRAQLEHFLEFDGVENAALLANNGDWLRQLSLIEFLRDTGKHFTVNYMVAKDSVKTRLAGDSGISFTEFSYMLLQAYDFLELFRRHGCTFQMGGSDQWGNITAGTQLIRRAEGEAAHGLTVPLVTNASGAKFGKSEAGTVWLDPARTSPFRFYQYWLNTADEDVISHLKFFTLLSREEIEALADQVEREPHLRAAQQRLAEEVTRNVHGADALAQAQRATDVLFGGDMAGLSAAELLDIFAEVPSSTVERSALEGEGVLLVELVKAAGFESSNKRARQLIESGGLTVGGQRAEDPYGSVTAADAIDGQVIVLRKGKRKYHLVRVEG